MEKSNFDQLIHRYLTGQVSESERVKIEAWLDVMKSEQGDDLQMTQADEEKLFEKITSRLDSVDDVVSFRPEKAKNARVFDALLFKVAAALLLLLVATLVITYLLKSSPVARFTAETAEKVILSDGTIAWLEKGSELTFQDNNQQAVRRATLTGEGLFEVWKDPERPFVIACGTMIVRVLGTSFYLKATGGALELNVFTGRVNVSSPKDSVGTNIGPLENVIFTKDGNLQPVGDKDPDVDRFISSTEYHMQFSNTTMDKVIERVEDKFEVYVNVENKDLYKCRLTADFTDQSLEKTLSMISDLLDISYVVDKKKVNITGNGCSH